MNRDNKGRFTSNSNNIFKLLEESIEKAIAINKQIRNTHKVMYFGKSYSNKNSFAKEFQTVHINPGRRTGKTQYIINNAKNGDVIYTPLLSMAEEIRSGLNLLNKNIDIVLINHNMKNTLGYIPNNIWVDNYSILNDYVDKNKIYNCLNPHNPYQTFIFLG